MSRRVPNRPAAQAGFTLPEALVVTVILGIFAGVVASALLMVIRVTDPTADRVEASFGPRFTSMAWAPDVASSEVVNPAGAACGSGTPVVSFRWVDDRTGVNLAVWSTLTSPSGASLVRSLCRDGTLVREAEVASAVLVPEVRARCDGGSCGTGATPQVVTLDVATREGLAFRARGVRRIT